MIDLYNFQQNVARFYASKPYDVDLLSLVTKVDNITSSDKATVTRLIGEITVLLARISNEFNINMDYAIASTWWTINHDEDG